MSDKEIHCRECGTYLGTIRDAKLHKGLVTICPECYGEHPEEEVAPRKTKTYSDDPVNDLMKMFGMGR